MKCELNWKKNRVINHVTMQTAGLGWSWTVSCQCQAPASVHRNGRHKSGVARELRPRTCWDPLDHSTPCSLVRMTGWCREESLNLAV